MAYSSESRLVTEVGWEEGDEEAKKNDDYIFHCVFNLSKSNIALTITIGTPIPGLVLCPT